jgi:hypothetical protein
VRNPKRATGISRFAWKKAGRARLFARRGRVGGGLCFSGRRRGKVVAGLFRRGGFLHTGGWLYGNADGSTGIFRRRDGRGRLLCFASGEKNRAENGNKETSEGGDLQTFQRNETRKNKIGTRGNVTRSYFFFAGFFAAGFFATAFFAGFLAAILTHLFPQEFASNDAGALDLFLELLSNKR